MINIYLPVCLNPFPEVVWVFSDVLMAFLYFDIFTIFVTYIFKNKEKPLKRQRRLRLPQRGCEMGSYMPGAEGVTGNWNKRKVGEISLKCAKKSVSPSGVLLSSHLELHQLSGL